MDPKKRKEQKKIAKTTGFCHSGESGANGIFRSFLRRAYTVYRTVLADA
jgi:hypothetical protein